MVTSFVELLYVFSFYFYIIKVFKNTQIKFRAGIELFFVKTALKKSKTGSRFSIQLSLLRKKLRANFAWDYGC